MKCNSCGKTIRAFAVAGMCLKCYTARVENKRKTQGQLFDGRDIREVPG
jgi:NMD protein affecting ribosome stability and mRNA decay